MIKKFGVASNFIVIDNNHSYLKHREEEERKIAQKEDSLKQLAELEEKRKKEGKKKKESENKEALKEDINQ